MMHPDTTLKHINDDIGFGVFATRDIAMGTIVYVKDTLEIIIPHNSSIVKDARYRAPVDKYTYIEPNGDRVLSWDIARFVNHSCECNTLSTGYGFEVAIRDIRAGEEITDDYGMHNCMDKMVCYCQSENCRGHVGYGDFQSCVSEWDDYVLPALLKANRVDQPLWDYMDPKDAKRLAALANNPDKYKSVAALEWQALRVEEVNDERIDTAFQLEIVRA